MKPRLQGACIYEERSARELMEQFGFSNPMPMPRIEKIVVNVGMGEAAKNPKLLDRWWPSWARSPARRP
jgi:large subunit ribosomal protein L5